MPGEGAGRVSPSPFEGGKPGGRARAGITPPPSGPREGLSPSPFERGRGRGKQGERSPEPGGVGGPAGAARATPPLAFEGAPSRQQERGRQPARRPGEEPSPGQGGAGQIPPRGHEGEPQRQRFGTPPPTGAGEREQRGGGQPSGYRQPVTPPPAGGSAGEARVPRERMQGAHAQPPPPEQQQQRGGAPASADHGQGQGRPEGGKKRQPKETPPPGQQ